MELHCLSFLWSDTVVRQEICLFLGSCLQSSAGSGGRMSVGQCTAAGGKQWLLSLPLSKAGLFWICWELQRAVGFSPLPATQFKLRVIFRRSCSLSSHTAAYTAVTTPAVFGQKPCTCIFSSHWACRLYSHSVHWALNWEIPHQNHFSLT